MALSAACRAGQCSPLEVVDAHLARISAVDPHVGAFSEVLAEHARAQAAAAVRRRERGALYGVPFGVKDLFDVAGTRTRAGSEVPFGDGRAATADATAVRHLRRAGAIVVGRTRTHEFAWGITTRHPRAGGTVNPWSPTRVAGGSSGGSAAAVAAREVPVAIGTDTGGSVRIPAAFCGVVGWKPTYGAIPLDGVVPLSRTLDHGGVLARTVADAALVAGAAGGSRTVELPRPGATRIGVAATLGVEDVVRALQGADIDMVEVVLPPRDEVRLVQVAIQEAEVLDLHQRELGTWPRFEERYGEDIAERLRLAARVVTPERTEAARRRREEVIAEVDLLLGGFDVDAVVLPAATCGPSTLRDPDHVVVGGRRLPLRDVVMPWTALANVAGLPACTVPVGIDDEAMPRAVQLLGRRHGEARLLGVAALVETLFPPRATVPLRDVGAKRTRAASHADDAGL